MPTDGGETTIMELTGASSFGPPPAVQDQVWEDFVFAHSEGDMYLRFYMNGKLQVIHTFSGSGPAHGNWTICGTYLHMEFNYRGDETKLKKYQFAPIDACAKTWASTNMSQEWHAHLLHVNVEEFRRPHAAATIYSAAS
jgi:hypothetical protein